MRLLSLALVLVLLLTPVFAQETTVRVTVRLVSVVASVRAPGGELARGLTKEDFEILDEGKPQPIRLFNTESAVPLSIALVVDASLSTARELKFEQQSAGRFIRSILRPQDRMSLFVFTNQVTQTVRFTSDAGRIEKGLHEIESEGGTSLFDAVYLVSHELLRQNGRKVIILVTDGGDTTSKTDFHGALRAALGADAVIYSVIVLPIKKTAFRDIGGEHALMLFSERTGGRAFTPEVTNENLDEVFAEIGDELRTEYVLGYYVPGDANTGDYRRIEVRLKRPGFTVQARKGYYLKDN